MPETPNPGSNPEEQIQQATLQYLQKRASAEQLINKTVQSRAKEAIQELEAQAKLIQQNMAAGRLTVQEGAKRLNSNKAQQTQLLEHAKSGMTKNLSTLADYYSKTQNILKASALGAILAFTIETVEAQKRLSTYAGKTASIFGGLGDTAGGDFGQGFVTSTSPYIAYISNDTREKFLQSLMALGTPLRGITGQNFKVLTDQLLVLGKAFNISTDSMSEMLFQFQDIFKESTAAAGKDIEQLANTAVALQVAPSKLLSLVNNLTSTFKLQKISIADVSSVFVSYRRNAQLGVEAATELTQKTVSALAGLDEGKIAGLLALTTGKGGVELGTSLVDFFKVGGKDVSSRLDLAITSFKTLETKFPAVMSNEFARTRLVMQTFGVSDFSTGVQLLGAIENTGKSGQTTADAVKKATDIIQGTSGTVDMMNNIISNMMSSFFASAVPTFTFIARAVGKLGGWVGGLDMQSLSANWEIQDQISATLMKLQNASQSGDQKQIDLLQGQLKTYQGALAIQANSATVTKDGLTSTSGLFDTMNDHLSKIKDNTLSTALSSKAIAASQEQMTVPVGTGAVTMMTPTALKNYVDTQIAAAKVPLDVKVTLTDTSGVFKAIKTVSSAANSR